MFRRISLQIVINPCRPRPNMALDAPGATSEFFQKNLWKERKFAAKLSHAQTKARIEYWVSFLPLQSLHALSLRVIAYEPGALTETMAKVGICEAHWSPLPTILAILEMILCARGKPACACVGLSLADANGLKYGVQRLRAEFVPCHAYTVLLAHRMPKVQMTWRTCNKVIFVLGKVVIL